LNFQTPFDDFEAKLSGASVPARWMLEFYLLPFSFAPKHLALMPEVTYSRFLQKITTSTNQTNCLTSLDGRVKGNEAGPRQLGGMVAEEARTSHRARGRGTASHRIDAEGISSKSAPEIIVERPQYFRVQGKYCGLTSNISMIFK
jgi:hypothetical protein